MTAREALAAYEARINAHDFDRLTGLIAPEAVFWFSDGSHQGLPAIRHAFERTWDMLAGERYWLDEVIWIAEGDRAAACIYRFNWNATVNGESWAGSGRGTTVFRLGDDGSWRIVHEHLSNPPA